MTKILGDSELKGIYNNSFTNLTSNFSINLDCNSENSDNNNIFDESFD